MRGFILAGTGSGVGKTTLAMGLMGCYENVSPFKVGPDYIDPSYHRAVTGNKSYNLDLYMMGENGVKYSFSHHHKDISIVEGVMGLYDGLGDEKDNFSTAHLSRVLGLPVVLVVDAKGRSTTVVAEILGYRDFDRDVNIAGVILNRVSSEKMYVILRDSIEKYTGIKCYGYLKNMDSLKLESRHLGLLQAEEIEEFGKKLGILKEELVKTIDIEGLGKLKSIKKIEKQEIFIKEKDRYKGKKVGIAKDSSFSFYYEDNIEFLRYLGMDIVEFSPMIDKRVPDVDILYFGGGYPENNVKKLSENIEFIESLKKFHNDGKIIYGECGGFMYLSRSIKGLDGKIEKMVDLIDCDIVMRDKLVISRFGYIEVEYDGVIGRGHEFHYSNIESEGNCKKVYSIRKRDGREWSCGYRNKNLIAGYPHLHFFGSLEILKKIIG